MSTKAKWTSVGTIGLIVGMVFSEIASGEPVLFPEPDGVPKNRFLSFQLVSEGLPEAIRVKIVKLYNTDPNDLDSEACPLRPAQFSDLSMFEGQVRWVGSPVSLPEADGDDPNQFIGAALQCDPHFVDWSTTMAPLGGDVLHVYGAEIVPCSRYEVQVVDITCSELADEACYSAPLTINTAQFANVAGYTNPYTTVSRIVDKLHGVPGMRKVDMLLRGNVPPVLSQVNMMDFAILFGAEWRFRPYMERGPEQCPARVPSCGDGILDPGEECDDGNGVGGDGCDGTCTMEDRTAVFALLPVDPAEIGAPPYPEGVRIVGNELFVPGGGIRVWLEITLSGWDPDHDGSPALDTFQVRIDSSGFNSGLSGALAPPMMVPCTLHEECQSVFGLGALCRSYVTNDLVCQAGFQDFNRADSLFLPATFPLVDTSARDFRFGFLGGGQNVVLDNGTIRYGGTLVLDVSADAAGTFTVGFDSRQDESFMFAVADPRHARIPIARMEPARITVSRGCCFSDNCLNLSPASCLDSGGTPVALCLGDCNGNGRDDTCDVTQGFSEDCNDNLIPDECEEDCNNNDITDECDIRDGISNDCNENLTPDECELDCNGNNVADDCDINEGTSEDCNLDGIPDDCQPNEDCNNNTFKDICDIGAGASVDCNANLVPDECDLTGLASLDDNSNSIPDECEQSPLADPSNLSANRFVGFVPRSEGAQTAIRVTLTKLYNIESSDLLNAVCPPRPDSLPDLPASNGQVRWVGPVASLPEGSGVDENRFAGAPLQCCPYFADWAQDLLAIDEDILYAFGAEIVPCSQYEVQVISATCLDMNDATCFSDPLTVRTGKWGDVSDPFGGSGQPNFTDIGKVVDKFKGLFPPLKVQGMLRGNVPPAGAPVSFTDIGRVVGAFKSIAYPEVGPSACVEACE